MNLPFDFHLSLQFGYLRGLSMPEKLYRGLYRGILVMRDKPILFSEKHEVKKFLHES